MPNPPTSSVAARRRMLIAVVLALIAVSLAWYLWPRQTHVLLPAASIVLVVSGDTQGWLTPCGCTANQSGGLLRRGTYLDDLRQKRTVLYADAGGAITGNTPYHALKFAAILRGEVQMKVAAHNLGAGELAFGPATLASLATTLNVPFLGTNTSTSAGAPVAEKLRIVKLDNLRIALAGVISARYQTADIKIAAPREAILGAIAGRKSDYDRLIVLAYMPEEELEALAKELPEADAVIGGPTGQAIAPHRVGPTLVASATNKGKFLAEIPLVPQDQPHIVELNTSFKDSADQLLNVAAYQKDLAAKDFPANLTGLVMASKKSGSVAGSESCQSCHQADYAAWSRSKHAHAWEPLTAKSMHVDPACQLCHTTNYGANGGFDSIASTPARINVGCESCHGPSEAHVKNPKTKTPFLAAAQCISCHDAENSPTFNYKTFWPKIQHGRPAPAMEVVP